MLEIALTFLKTNWIGVLIIITFVSLLVFLWKIGKRQTVINIINSLIAKAEQQFGSGTGPIKLAAVWEGIYAKIPWYIRLFFPKEELEKYIEDGVKWLDKQLETQGINLLSYADEKALKTNIEVTDTKEFD